MEIVLVWRKTRNYWSSDNCDLYFTFRNKMDIELSCVVLLDHVNLIFTGISENLSIIIILISGLYIVFVNLIKFRFFILSINDMSNHAFS